MSELNIATPDCEKRIELFLSALTALCGAHRLRLIADNEPIEIEDVDRDGLAGAGAENFPAVASLASIGGDGAKEFEFVTINEEDWPEEHAALAAARAEGRIW